MTVTKEYIPLALHPKLVNVKQLLQVLSISVAHVHKLDNDGKLPRAINLGRSVRWSTSEIQAWIDSGCIDRLAWQARSEEKGQS